MASLAPPSDQAADLLQNLSLDSQNKSLEIPEPTKKTTSVYQYGAIDSGVAANGQIQPMERSMTPFLQELMDPNLVYHPYASPYFYGGYTGTESNWEDYSRYTTEGVDMTSGVYADNGSLMYGGYGYAPYSPYSPAASPVPTMGNDGQLYAPQQYQYPQYFQPLTPTRVPLPSSQAASSQVELSSSTVAEQKPLPLETAKANSTGIVSAGGVKGNNGSMPYKPMYQNSLQSYNNAFGRGTLPGGIAVSGFQDPSYGLNGQYRSTGVNSSFYKANNFSSSRNNFRQNSDYMGLQQTGAMSDVGSHSFVNRMYPNKFYGQYGNAYRTNYGYGSSGYDSRLAQGWLAVDGKYKNRGRGSGYYGYRNETIDSGLDERNRGPRAKGAKNMKSFSPVAIAVKGQNLQMGETVTRDGDEKSMVPDREQYNRTDFSEEYADAKFYIIKSYSEDDVHKSIKYNVWASTPSGNKKLEAAYQESQQKPGGCPIFLFFSVNTSGQFVGLAEMVGPVDFDKNVEYWQQDKWTGCFALKWHIVKDVPNSLLKHITLENNENKPVTNSRDTQEVKLQQGLKMIKIFKEHNSKTSILDDFEFYEKRQKIIQEKKTKQQQFQKQVLEAKTADEKKEAPIGLQDTISYAAKEHTSASQSNSGLMPLENGSTAKSGDSASKANKPVVSEKKILSNGIANGC